MAMDFSQLGSGAGAVAVAWAAFNYLGKRKNGNGNGNGNALIVRVGKLEEEVKILREWRHDMATSSPEARLNVLWDEFMGRNKKQ